MIRIVGYISTDVSEVPHVFIYRIRGDGGKFLRNFRLSMLVTRRHVERNVNLMFAVVKTSNFMMTKTVRFLNLTFHYSVMAFSESN